MDQTQKLRDMVTVALACMDNSASAAAAVATAIVLTNESGRRKSSELYVECIEGISIDRRGGSTIGRCVPSLIKLFYSFE